jgi:purine-binding chemotaxis protein CheW
METDTISSEMLQFVTFRLAAEKFGVNILKVQEINNLKDFAKIPHAPTFVEGAINLRGKVIPVLNLRKKFGIEEKALDDFSKIVIMNVRGHIMGILVDSVSDVLRIPQNVIMPPPPVSSDVTDAEFVQGIARLDQGLVIILDMEKLLGRDEHDAVFGASGLSAA